MTLKLTFAQLLSKCESTTAFLRTNSPRRLNSFMVHVTQKHVKVTESFPSVVYYSFRTKVYAMYLICLFFSPFFFNDTAFC